METLETLYEEYYQFSMNYARKLTGKKWEDLEDFVSDAWLKVVRFFDQYEQDTNFIGWLSTIMWSMAINDWRRQKRFELEFIQFDEAWCTRVEPYEPYLDYGDRVYKAMMRLSPEFRETMLCKIVDDMRQKDVAKKLGIEKNTVASRVCRATRLMRDYLKAA